ncbi:MAG TPA: glycosyl hydrolase 115 family protein [Opitutaceae bacterium]|nr:glycosyl hydrolase 115 family protein [Opitutaceae bacterium]
MPRTLFLGIALLLVAPIQAADMAGLSISGTDTAGAVKLVLGQTTASIYVDAQEPRLVGIAAGLLSDDVNRVTGRHPPVVHDAAQLGPDAVIVGSIGHSAVIDRLIAAGRIDPAGVRGQWETYRLQVVDHPLPGVAQALVIVGSDRRGAAYGVVTLSEAIGVSPWYWWADVTPRHRDALVVAPQSFTEGPPSVKYRGIFINDEDWGLEPWAAKTFEPAQGNIGPKTYERVFELLVRLKANYLWPAMHPVSTEFARIPANVALADDWGIVMGASHTEAMNRNNVLWPEEGTGEWRYDTNASHLLAYWEEWAKQRGKYEAVWTLGIRGVHDSAMLGPPDPDAKMHVVEQAIDGQRGLLQKYVNPDLRQVPQLFAPYKEVLELYQRGMKVPEDVTLLWTDDNFGYIRQLPTPEEQKRSGASGIYYHISYLGRPRSYVWLETTPPALIWEEMTKAYAYGADRIWVVNVGDIKPGEIGMDFWFRLGWNVHAYDRESVAHFLTDWAAREFGRDQAPAIAAIMERYYRLGFDRKPEAMDRTSFNETEARQRLADYDALLKTTDEIAARLPADRHDAFYELVLYPVKVCTLVNHVYLAADAAEAMKQIETETAYFNDILAGGKWKNLMTVRGTTSAAYGFKWPTGTMEFPKESAPATAPELSVNAGHFTRNVPRGGGEWKSIAGLGRQSDALTVFPVTVPSIAEPAQIVRQSPELDYEFTTAAGAASVQVAVYAVPTHRINATRGQRYAVAIDDQAPQIVGFEQTSGDSTNPAWQQNVIRNISVNRTDHAIAGPGRHTLRVFMVDPGVVLEKFVVSSHPLPASEFGPPETVSATSR